MQDWLSPMQKIERRDGEMQRLSNDEIISWSSGREDFALDVQVIVLSLLRNVCKITS